MGRKNPSQMFLRRLNSASSSLDLPSFYWSGADFFAAKSLGSNGLYNHPSFFKILVDETAQNSYYSRIVKNIFTHKTSCTFRV